MKTNIFTILFFCLINTSWSQSTFQRGYTNSNHSQLVSAQQTTDGNIIAAGDVASGNYNRVCLVKTDMNGDTMWTKTFGSLANYYCHALEQTSDNGFIIGGKVIDSVSNVFKSILIKTDSNGNVIWSKTYERASFDAIYSIKQIQNGDYFIAGYGYIRRINSIGNILWEKYLNDDVINYGIGVNIDIKSIFITNDGGVVLGGSIDTTYITPGGIFQKPSYVYILKMNASGNIMWTKGYKSAHNIFDKGSSIAQTSDKGFILTGETYVPVGINVSMNHIYLVKTDSLGNLIWSKKFDSGANDSGTDAKQTSDGGYIVTGTSNGFVGNGLWTSNSFLIKTDASGNVAWCKYYGSASNANDQSHSVNITNDGGYLVSGITTVPNGYPDDIYLLKTDALGNVNCRGFNWQLHDSTYTSVSFALNQTVINSNTTVSNLVINSNHVICSNYGDCTVGLTELEKDAYINIYPNPSNGIFKIIGLTENTQISIYNPMGQEIYSFITKEINENINISNVPNGIYIIQMSSKSGNFTKKLIKKD